MQEEPREELGYRVVRAVGRELFSCVGDFLLTILISILSPW